MGQADPVVVILEHAVMYRSVVAPGALRLDVLSRVTEDACYTAQLAAQKGTGPKRIFFIMVRIVNHYSTILSF